MQLMPLEKSHFSRDSVRKARESHLIDKAMKFISLLFFLFAVFLCVCVCVARHFRLSLLNNFYCNILHLYNIVIPFVNSVTSVNLKKAVMASRNNVMKKQYTLF